MAKKRTHFVCEACGATQPKWMGRCPECGAWNTLVEKVITEPSDNSKSISAPAAEARAFSLSDIPPNTRDRIFVPIEELNRVLGGGIVPGSVVLLAGDPGIGKSTLLLQLATTMSERAGKALYVSGEESLQQIKLRANRLSLDSSQLYVLAETNLEQIMGQIEEMDPALVIVDSIQSIYTEGREASAGSIGQVRDCATSLLRLAKVRNIPTFIVGHVTKTGSIAGPMALEHIVDTVLYLEGERFHTYRLLRSVKNRFGSTNEVGVFEMCDKGLLEVSNPSQMFLEERLGHASGSAVAVTMEGTRPILVEIQALVSQSNLNYPRRTCNGIDTNRLLLLSAVLSKRVGLKVGDQDIFVNVVGGLRVREPAVDLAIAVAIASSYYNRPVSADLAIFGEVGLAGELRRVSQSERRCREASKLGFEHILMPSTKGQDPSLGDGVRPITARSVAEAIEAALDKTR
ncbi:MAG: DNA repair protein RadA [Chloroflexota bacterium]|nr:DNA repair protein RadA [Chloroflexota bacterium]